MVGSSLRDSEKRVKKQLGRAVEREGLVSPSTRILRHRSCPSTPVAALSPYM